MRFVYTEEQSLLRDAARKFFKEECPLSHVRAMEKDPLGFDPAIYKKAGELGLLGAHLPEGGMGALGMVIVCTEMGRSLYPSPFWGSCVVASALLADQEMVRKIGSGQAIVSLALHDEGALEASRKENEWRLTGSRLLVPFVKGSDRILVFNNKRLFLADADDKSLAFSPMPVISGERVYEVKFQGTRAEEVPDAGKLGDALALGALAGASLIFGALERSLEMAVEYAKVRVQFGHPIGKFQAIQHMLARSAMEVEGLRLLVHEAAWAADKGMPWQSRAGMAKMWANRIGVAVGRRCHQTFGGFGFMAETDMQLYYRRVRGIAINMGSGTEAVEMVTTSLENVGG